MIDLTRHPRLLRLLSHYYRVLRILQGRHRQNQETGAQRGTFYEAVWRDAAREIGAEIESLGGGFFEICCGDLRTRVRQSCTAIDDPVTLDVAGNKPLVYRLLARHGLPTPNHVTFTLREIGQAVAFLRNARRECVVKPADGTGAGRGVTTGITTTSQLAHAAASASVYCRDLLVEEQVEGDNYRLLYLDGELLDAIQRKPPTVVGDGKSSLASLVRQANARRAGRCAGRCPPLLTMDLDLERTLAKQGLTLRSVPAAGSVVRLKTVINQNLAEDNVTATDLCDSLVQDGAQAAAAVGARLAGVDVLTPDPAVPLAEAGGVILEVNTTPGFHHHYGKPDGSFPVAVRVLQRLFHECGMSLRGAGR